MKKFLVIILMILAMIGIAKDLIMIMSGATFTWIGILVGIINVVIVGKGWDFLERV
jgi:hypothetical protein